VNPDGNLVGHATGEVELEGSVLVIKRIHVRMELRAPETQREAAERAHGVYADSCPVYRSVKAAIAVTTELDFRAA
jgi:organic hydroperoxide reductase OsmC/OhrA